MYPNICRFGAAVVVVVVVVVASVVPGITGIVTVVVGARVVDVVVDVVVAAVVVLVLATVASGWTCVVEAGATSTRTVASGAAVVAGFTVARAMDAGGLVKLVDAPPRLDFAIFRGFFVVCGTNTVFVTILVFVTTETRVLGVAASLETDFELDAGGVGSGAGVRTMALVGPTTIQIAMHATGTRTICWDRLMSATIS